MAGGKRIELAKNPSGVRILPDGEIHGLSTIDAKKARSALICHAPFRAAIEPSQSELASLWKYEVQRRTAGGAVGVLAGVRVESAHGVLYGLGQYAVLENAIHLGSHGVALLSDAWFRDRYEYLVELGVALSHTLPAVVPKPERGGASWPSWVVLLSGAPPHERNGIVRSLQLAAGLLKITLRVEFDADARFAVVSRGLRQRPPTGLLIWEQRVGNAQRFAKLYTSARPSGVVDFFSPERPDDPRSLIGDLLVHLQLLTEAWQRPKEQISWTEVKIRATALQSSSFVLTDRALSQLASSPYPDPERMLSHLERLAKLAAEFGTGRGRLGARLEDAGRLLGLDIALFDSSLNAPNIVVEGSVLSVRAEPHVKVDDHKSPDKCGRIYFAVDSDNYRFIVDHVGVHDYGYR